MITITLWLLLSAPAEPRDVRVLDTFRSREACEEAWITEHIAGTPTRCAPFKVEVVAGSAK